MWTLVFLTYGMIINVSVYETESDCLEVSYHLNQHVIDAEYNCERY